MDGMRLVALLCIGCVSSVGCSWALVRGPRTQAEPVTDPRAVQCTSSDFVPSLDSFSGAAAFAGFIGGTIYEYTSDNANPKRFELFIGVPLIELGVLYFMSASFGTNRVEHCREVKDQLGSITPITPIEGMPAIKPAPEPPPPPTPKPDDDPQIEIE